MDHWLCEQLIHSAPADGKTVLNDLAAYEFWMLSTVWMGIIVINKTT